RHGRRLHRRGGSSSPAAPVGTQRGSRLRPRSRHRSSRSGRAAPRQSWWRALGFALPTRNLALRRGADGGCVRCSSCVAAARRKLGRSPSLSRQQQRQQRQSPTEPVGLGVLPGLASYQHQQQQQ
uniref:Os08g0442700 protein n=1 Tax=Macrostomum lignano TaxID=282301 RepID=A0A1I8FTJ5_9PLAT